jgi:hypothetical protein
MLHAGFYLNAGRQGRRNSLPKALPQIICKEMGLFISSTYMNGALPLCYTRTGQEAAQIVGLFAMKLRIVFSKIKEMLGLDHFA